MPQSLTQLYVHIIFSSKNRIRCLNRETRSELYPYMGTVLTNLQCPPIQIGGEIDHCHILCVLSKNLAVATLLEKAKTPTSRWLNEKGVASGKFHWQKGYAAFSVSQSHVERVKEYIADQEERHRRMTFQEGLRKFFKKYQVPYDERYVWD